VRAIGGNVKPPHRRLVILRPEIPPREPRQARTPGRERRWPSFRRAGQSLTEYRQYALHGLLLALPVVAIATAVSSPVSNAGSSILSNAIRQSSAPAEGGNLRAPALVPIAQDILARHQAEAAAIAVPDKPEPTEPSATATATPAPQPQQISFTYTIQPGDTVDAVAAAFGIDPTYILWNNPIGDSNLLLVGETLVVPAVNGILYDVRFGDTLWDIANAYQVLVDDIVAYSENGLVSRDSVIEGMVLLVPGAVPPAPPPEPEPVYVAEESLPEPAAVAAVVPVAESPAVSSSGFIWPFHSAISTYFGEDGHKGLDLEGLGREGEPVVAAASGQVVLVVWSDWAYGNHVIIDHGDGIQTVYGHLSDIWVTQGEYVSQGQAVGAIGNTGYSTGPHLHFEVRLYGAVVDPLAYLP
jgi:murein DD-endopeptidase MepM/ murein hydrolase activator NlpD